MTPVCLPYASAKRKRKLMPSPKNGQVSSVTSM
uniref:Uncharacterized protein n=1 Tax=Myoviridae sp. ct0Tg8 TaxID=2826598 RepID=A0A8S5NBD6_9CAUD|nr:MAG TPA: hypothetical protein [Myoviridae sp. ct0Tg8]